MDDIEIFNKERHARIMKQSTDANFQRISSEFINESVVHKYMYNFSWMGIPIIQFPQDMIAMQEIIWQVKPDLIIETGIAHGGSLIYYASLLELLGKGHVLGIDIDIRPHNRNKIENHPMYKRITMIEGSSVSTEVSNEVKRISEGKKTKMVILDSNHTHNHVLKELELYSPLVTKDSYLIVFDTIVEDLPENLFPDRPWDKGNNPKTAVMDFLSKNNNYVYDKTIHDKLLISVAPHGFLKKIS